YGRSDTSTTTREVVTQNFFNALNAVTDGSGNIAGTSANTHATTETARSTWARLNGFGNGQASRAALDYLTAIATQTQRQIQFDAVADIKGSIAKLPAGEVKFVLGYEHRYESTNFRPGAFYRGEANGDGTYTQYGNSIPITPVAGSYH